MPGLLLMSIGCATLRPGAPEGAVDIIAHRGASAYAPENTLAAFQRAIDLKADWFELDCHLSRDNQVVVSHDSNLKRTTGVEREIPDLTLAEIKALDAGAWKGAEFTGEQIPTLTEALELAKGRIGVYVEVKNAQDDMPLIQQLIAAQAGLPEMMRLVEENGTRNLALTQGVIADIRKAHMEKQVVIQSFSPIICLVALAEAPEIRTEFLAARDSKHPEQFEQLMAFAWRLNVAGFNLNNDSMTPEFVQQVHAADKTTAVWTVDDAGVMNKLRDWGVDAIITNKPDVAREVLGR